MMLAVHDTQLVCFAAARSTSEQAAESSSTTSTPSATRTSQGNAAPTTPSASVPADTPAGVDSKAAKPRRGVRATVGHMVSTVQLLQPGVTAAWKRAFVVDLMVSVQVPLLSPEAALLLLQACYLRCGMVVLLMIMSQLEVLMSWLPA